MMSRSKFYRAYEDKYRGSRELIKSRLEFYSPLLDMLKSSFQSCSALDLGCGRGEWLELLGENGFSAKGIDLDDGMLSACLEIGLDVSHGDGVEYLGELPSGSLHLISAFHVVEHISFDQLMTLVESAYRVLVPGGILILETPNSENLVVGSSSFYSDPTHLKPIPSLLLSFVSEFVGFSRNKVVRLQENPELKAKQKISFSDAIFGVSPDYSIIAQKPCDSSISGRFDNFFEQDFGVSLNDLSSKLDLRFVEIEEKVNEAITRAGEAEARAGEAWHNYFAIENSNSWKITKPIRVLSKFLRNVYNELTVSRGSHLRRIIKKALVASITTMNKKTTIRKLALKLLSRLPRVEARLKAVVKGRSKTEEKHVADLSPRGKKYYEKLKNITQQKRN